MSKLVYLSCETRHDIPPERVLDAAREANLDGVVILAFDADEELYFASSYADGGTVLWLMELARMRLFAGEPSE